uniref:Vps5 domain-containing protein n=1 Tax=Haemonchus contortus TaxID=6289 RepID=A0A7I4XY96_HAECO
MDEAVRRMDQLEAEFGEISKLIREEIGRFEVQRRHDMRQLFIEYLESLVQTHTEEAAARRYKSWLKQHSGRTEKIGPSTPSRRTTTLASLASPSTTSHCTDLFYYYYSL